MKRNMMLADAMKSTLRALQEKAVRKEAMQMEENRKRLSARKAHILMDMPHGPFASYHCKILCFLCLQRTF